MAGHEKVNGLDRMIIAYLLHQIHYPSLMPSAKVGEHDYVTEQDEGDEDSEPSGFVGLGKCASELRSTIASKYKEQRENRKQESELLVAEQRVDRNSKQNDPRE